VDQVNEIKMKAYITLLRPLNCVMTSIAVLTAGLIAIGRDIQGSLFIELGAMICAFIFAGAGNALNDYYDAETDRINHPERPIPSGRIQRSGARVFAIILFVVSNLLAGFISWYLKDILPVLILMAATVLMVSYEIRFKARGFVGNAVISVLIALGFIFGGTIVQCVEMVILPATLALLSNLGREILKDIEDIKGDVDRRTLPMKIGIYKATLVSSGFFASAIILSPLPYALGILSGIYLVIVGIADIIFIYTIVTSFGSPSNAQRASKLGMVVALVAFVAGGVL